MVHRNEGLSQLKQKGLIYFKDEYGRLVFKTEREAYKALPDTKRNDIKRYFRWNRTAAAWVSKARDNTRDAESILIGIGAKSQSSGKLYTTPKPEKTAYQAKGHEGYSRLEKARKEPAKPRSIGWKDYNDTTVVVLAKGLEVHAQDIPYDIAYNAHRGTSHVPDKRAKSVQQSYVKELQNSFKKLEQKAINPEQKKVLIDQFKGVISRYRDLYLSYLNSRSSVMSAMITGPSGFNSARNEKKSRASDKKAQALWEFVGKQEGYISRSIHRAKNENQKIEDNNKAYQEFLKEMFGYVWENLKVKTESPLNLVKVDSSKPVVVSTTLMKGKIDRRFKRDPEFVVKFLKELAASEETIFTNRSSVWKYLPEADRPTSKRKATKPATPKKATNPVKPAKGKSHEAKKTNRATQKNGNGSKRPGFSDTAKKKATSQKTQDQAQARRAKIEVKYENLGAVPAGGRQTNHWFGSSLIPVYNKARKGPAMAPGFRYWDHSFLLREFDLKAWEFGQWATQEDRFNYVCATGIALHDIAKVIGVSRKSIGLGGKITMAIGARGKSAARGHFEPHTYAINLTRFKDNPSDSEIARNPFLKKYPKEVRFLAMGGAGVLAHEYGHALDYFIGGYIDQHPTQHALSDGTSTRKRTDENVLAGSGPRSTVEAILSRIIWENEQKGELSPYYKGVTRWMQENGIKSTYWIRRNELFARAWEQYVGFALKGHGIENAFLHKNKYEHYVYMNPAEIRATAPLFSKLTSQIKSIIK